MNEKHYAVEDKMYIFYTNSSARDMLKYIYREIRTTTAFQGTVLGLLLTMDPFLATCKPKVKSLCKWDRTVGVISILSAFCLSPELLEDVCYIGMGQSRLAVGKGCSVVVPLHGKHLRQNIASTVYQLSPESFLLGRKWVTLKVCEVPSTVAHTSNDLLSSMFFQILLMHRQDSDIHYVLFSLANYMWHP